MDAGGLGQYGPIARECVEGDQGPGTVSATTLHRRMGDRTVLERESRLQIVTPKDVQVIYGHLHQCQKSVLILKLATKGNQLRSRSLSCILEWCEKIVLSVRLLINSLSLKETKEIRNTTTTKNNKNNSKRNKESSKA